ncbi:D-3-phosphoglycerate dehydrogenase [Rhizoctonia solani AG-1 IB]|uniref:D-3-phosphoglycerate dehydrogenase n=1 Tax=Thanatephorus cucumeris (strain AG1-IB / isolate 7/3/14) TaxID=1108050 RepID=A0A0B7FHP7_THACB|nr:D-3-phosphoglycerate dehydrogenase [Rhizoctonia solani AG-1 IB]
MSTPIAIPRQNHETFDDHAVSTSPPFTRHHAADYGTSPRQSSPTFNPSAVPAAGVRPKVLKPFATEELRLLLLENISQDAVRAFTDLGFQVDFHKKAFSEAELVDSIGKYHAIGIRSKSKITARVLKAATKLLVIGCFCIGTNQVDLDTAARAGIPVFNSPFSNSRSVAELVIAEVIALSRQLFERAYEMRAGTWNKLSVGCWEIRGKTLGIVGYGHIGSQLSVLAEAFGMRVLYYDVLNLMPLGSATQVSDLEALLSQSDFVTLHVPELQETTGMISTKELAWMRRGAYLINNARGKVVDIPALVEALESKKLAGAAIDVFPAEPGGNGQPFDDQLNPWASRLRALPNVILTPHIGGSTEEAQRMIGFEVSSALARYLSYGATLGAVNFPEVDLRAITAEQDFIRVCYVHQNQPGVLRQLNEILMDHNVEKQYSDSKGDIAYLMADISNVSEAGIQDIHDRISHTKANIITRLLT